MKCPSCNKNEAVQLFTSFAPCESCVAPKSNNEAAKVDKFVLIYPATGAPAGWTRAGWTTTERPSQTVWSRQEIEHVAKQCSRALLNARAIIEGIPSAHDSIVYYFN